MSTISFSFSLFGVTSGGRALFALQTQSPRPPTVFLSIIMSDMLQHRKGNAQQFSEGCYLSVISFEARDIRNGVCVSRCYLFCVLRRARSSYNYGISIIWIRAQHLSIHFISWLPSYKSITRS
jgi:hypothetical protein